MARGHEEEKRRLQSRGRLAGALVGLGVATPEIVQALRRKKLPHYLPLLAPAIGAGIGHLGGSHVALKRLELSQRRGEEGHYAPLRKQALSPITLPMTSTMRRARTQINNVKRPLASPVVHKPMVVKTPMPAPPVVEPTTRTPTMMPKTSSFMVGAMAKVAAYMKIVGKDTKKRAAVDDMGEPARGWRGTRLPAEPRGNVPEPEAWRGHDF